MAKRKVVWSKNALCDLLEIMNYYNKRNKSNLYGSKLNSAIRAKLFSIDTTIALPQKTNVENLFHFTHNHISVCFEIFEDELRVQLVIDDRRNPGLIDRILNSTL